MKNNNAIDLQRHASKNSKSGLCLSCLFRKAACTCKLSDICDFPILRSIIRYNKGEGHVLGAPLSDNSQTKRHPSWSRPSPTSPYLPKSPDPTPSVARPAISMPPVVAPTQMPHLRGNTAVADIMGHRRPKMIRSCLDRGKPPLKPVISWQQRCNVGVTISRNRNPDREKEELIGYSKITEKGFHVLIRDLHIFRYSGDWWSSFPSLPTQWVPMETHPELGLLPHCVQPEVTFEVEVLAGQHFDIKYPENLGDEEPDLAPGLCLTYALSVPSVRLLRRSFRAQVYLRPSAHDRMGRTCQ